MPTAHRLSQHPPNDPDPSFFEGIEDWVEALWEHGVEVHFMEETDLSQYARQWRWMSLVGPRLELVVCDDLTIGAREIVLSGEGAAFELALPALEARLALEPYEAALARARAQPHSAEALLRACVASPRPPTAELEALVIAALGAPDADLRYRAVSGAVTLQSASMRAALQARVELETEPSVVERVRRGVASFVALEGSEP